MPKTLPGGLQLEIPLSGETNWGQPFESEWAKINDHAHTGLGDGNQISGSGIADGSITSAKLANNFAIAQQTYDPPGSAGTLDWDDGSKVLMSNTNMTGGSFTITLDNPITGGEYRIIYKELTGSPKTIVWPGNVLWQGGEEPTQHMSPTDILYIRLDYDGTDYYTTWNIDYS